jgi:hypothetical protein
MARTTKPVSVSVQPSLSMTLIGTRPWLQGEALRDAGSVANRHPLAAHLAKYALGDERIDFAEHLEFVSGEFTRVNDVAA